MIRWQRLALEAKGRGGQRRQTTREFLAGQARTVNLSIVVFTHERGCSLGAACPVGLVVLRRAISRTRGSKNSSSFCDSCSSIPSYSTPMQSSICRTTRHLKLSLGVSGTSSSVVVTMELTGKRLFILTRIPVRLMSIVVPKEF